MRKQPTPILQVRSFLESVQPPRSAFPYQIRVSTVILLIAEFVLIARNLFYLLVTIEISKDLIKRGLRRCNSSTKSQSPSATNTRHRISQPSLLGEYHSNRQPRRWCITINEPTRKAAEDIVKQTMNPVCLDASCRIHFCQSSDILQLTSGLDCSTSNAFQP
jgi:hypothetical protein